MRRDKYRLFSVGHIGPLTLKNRLVRSATQGDGAAIQAGEHQALRTLYRNLAMGGVGLIITGDAPGFSQEQLAEGNAARPALLDVYAAAFASVADEVHRTASDCKIIVQLGGPGRGSGIGASDVPEPFHKGPVKAVSIAEITQIVAAYAATIARFKQSGLDGIQLHAGHGHSLLHSFLSPYTNRRTDGYGGPAANRARIIREIVAKAREKVGDWPILIKMNCTDNLEGGIGLDTFPEMAREVAQSGVDAIEVSGGTMDCLVRSEQELGFRPLPVAEAHTRIGSPEKQSYFLPYLQNLALDIPVILVGGNRHAERLEQILIHSPANFIALCRPLISEPDLPIRWLERRGGPETDCISCNACLVPVQSGKLSYCVLKHDKEEHKAAQALLASWVQGALA